MEATFVTRLNDCITTKGIKGNNTELRELRYEMEDRR